MQELTARVARVEAQLEEAMTRITELHEELHEQLVLWVERTETWSERRRREMLERERDDAVDRLQAEVDRLKDAVRRKSL